MIANHIPASKVDKMFSKEKVIVIGCSLPGYAVIRALANKNIHIIAMTYAEGDTAQFSRYVSEVVHCPVPEKDEEQFITFLTRNANRWGGALILETSDSTAIALSKHKELLSKYYKIATPDWQTLSIFVEKEKTYVLAKEANIPFPKSISLYKLEDVDEISDILYPCILKPVRSFEFASKFHVKNFEVNNENELKEKYRICLDAQQSMILQEIIPGPDENLYKLQGYLNSQGKMVGKFFYRKLRQNPPQFGVLRVGISTDRYPEVERLTEELLCRVNYRGYFSNEFKKDPRDGQLKLIENNCRMPRSGMLAIASGVNFPWLIYQDLVMNQYSDIKEHKTGTYWIDLLPDISNSLFHHDEENISLRDYIGPYFGRDKVFADLDFHDLGPFARLMSKKLENLKQKYRKRSSRSA
jgi:predicted ATP-grasp superfamily ATP-dependent carboligase